MNLLGDLLLVIGCAIIAIGGLLGIGFHHPDWWAKLLVIAGFILFTNPVGSSTIARAARISGIKPWKQKH